MKTVAELLKSKIQHSQQVHTIEPQQMVLDGRVVGIVSERDYARKMVLLGRSSIGTPVSEIMSAHVITVTPQQNIDHCMALMTEGRLRHLPVVDNGQLLGLLSIGDLVKEAIAEQARLIEQLQQYIRGE